MKAQIRWLVLILVITVLFFWKISLTGQFSILIEYEGANQVYAWDNFSAAMLKEGILPLWDPYTHAGRTFVGEMQTGLFYPLKIILYVWPFDRGGLLSQRALHNFFVLAHVLAAWFMFLFAGEMGLSRFSALIAGLCFSLGGFVGRVNWPDMLDTAVWLPLIGVFLVRSFRFPGTRRGALSASFAGLCLGTAILAGRLHVVMMDVLVILSAAAYFGSRSEPPQARTPVWRTPWGWSAAVVAIIGFVSFLAGAIQLLPSIEYSGHAIRYLGGELALPATRKIPYADLSDGFAVRAVASFLIGHPFGGADLGGEYFTPYFGVLPLLLVVIGIRLNWSNPWIRYLTVLAGTAYFYALGLFSFLHGLGYALVPYLWMAREAGRFIYLTHFAMAVLAGFGAQSLLSGPHSGAVWADLARFIKRLVIGIAAVLALPSLFGQPEMNEWIYLSFLFILATYGLFIYAMRSAPTRAMRFVAFALILCDLNAFRWGLHDKKWAEDQRSDHIGVLLQSRKVANFFQSQPGLFRVQMEAVSEPNIGDVYGIHTTGGMAATLLRDYANFLALGQPASDLLNVRYIVKSAPAQEANPVYEDEKWAVYENPSHLPRAWVVHRVVQEERNAVFTRVTAPDFDRRREAVVTEPLDVDPASTEGDDFVSFTRHQADRLELTVRAASRGLLVLSEVYYPGWRATVNGASIRIIKVNGLFRGVEIPAGESTVVLRYAPASILIGAILSVFALAGVLAFAIVVQVGEKRAGKDR